ncbi:MAG TPA: type II toxin-antitoxin system CcdA family antitoxin [Acidimicrobiales bacterium]|jgi:post-segregation antitoxin (ccd killing protein)
MAQWNVYLPEDLAVEVRAAGLNVSRLTQAALHQELACSRARTWLQRVAWERTTRETVSHDATSRALRAVETDP